jgi:hypothetical protein
MNAIRLYLHRLFRRPAVTSDMPIYTRRLPDGVALDLEAYLGYVITSIADDPEARALFDEVVKDRKLSGEHDGWEPEELHLENLATYLGYEVMVRGKSLKRLGDRLLAAFAADAPAPKTASVVQLPRQRKAGAA